MTGAEYITRGVTRVLGVVENIVSGSGTAEANAEDAWDIMTDPLSQCLVSPMLAMLTRACMEVSAATGRPVADVVAGWRKAAAADIDASERLLGGGR